MAKPTQDNLAELWLLLDQTPLFERSDRSREIIRRELERIKESAMPPAAARKHHDEIAIHCRDLIRLLPASHPTIKQLEATADEEKELARRYQKMTEEGVRSLRAAKQYQILALLSCWLDARVEDVVPIFQVASTFVFGKHPGIGRAWKIILAYRRKHFVIVREPTILRPSKHLEKLVRRRSRSKTSDISS